MKIVLSPRRLAAIGLVFLASSPVSAQTNAPTLSIKVEEGKGAAGVVLFESQGQNVGISVTATDASGKLVRLDSYSPQWTVDNSDVVSLYGGEKGVSTRIVAGTDGHAVVSVSALRQTATLRVAVGKARRELKAEDVTPEFRVARLEISATGGNDQADKLEGRALLLGENGHNLVLKARAFNSAGKPIPLSSLPVSWSTDNADVVELDGEGSDQVMVIGRNSGETTVTATVQGVRVAVQGHVGDARTNATPTLLAERAIVEATPVSTAPTAGPAQLPITVRPENSATAPSSARPEPAQTARSAPQAGSRVSAGTSSSGTTPATVNSDRIGGKVSTTLTPPTTDSAAVQGPTATAVTTMAPMTATAGYVITSARNFRGVAGNGYNSLFWDPVGGAKGYVLRRYDFVSQQRVVLKNAKGDTLLTEPTFRDEAVTAGVQYGYRLRTYFPGENGLVADPDTTQGVNSTPKRAGVTGITQEIFRGSGTVDFRFKSAPGASSHILLRSPFPPSPTSFAAIPGSPNTGVWTRDMTGKPGETYVYKIRASFPDGEVIDSDNMIIKIPAPPVGPTALSATAIADGVELRWVGDPEATTYSVWRWRGTTREQMYESVSSPFIDRAARNGVTYRFTVFGKYSDRNTSTHADITITVPQ